MTAANDGSGDITRRVESLETKFELLRGIVNRSDSDESGVPDVYWADFPESERWKVAWGTWWRMFLASLIVYVALFVLVMALSLV